MFIRTIFYRQRGPAIAPDPLTTSLGHLCDSMKVHRSFRLDRVASCVNENDVILAVQDSRRTFSFLGFPDAPREDVAKRLAGVPLSAHYFHSVCGREGSACDFYADVDLEPSDDGESVLRYIVDHVQRALGEGPPPLVSILSGSTALKQSYHVHVRSPTVAFRDFGVVRHVAEGINESLSHEAIDLGCYRESGMLRCAFSRKAVTSSGMAAPMMPYTPKDPQLVTATAATVSLSVPELLSLSLITRQPRRSSSSIRIIHTAARCDAVAAPATATSPSRSRAHYFDERYKWLRYTQAVRAMRRLPDGVAGQYATWVRVGLALHSFNGGGRTFEDWLDFSARSPKNFSEEDCAKKWEQFQRRPQCHTWRRGYNYLQHTVWRACGLAAPNKRNV